jgi:hypothetical protein
MSDIFAIIDGGQNISASVTSDSLIANMNIVTLNSLSEVTNVDTTILENGAVLVFKTTTNKWTSTRTLEEQNLEGGHY